MVQKDYTIQKILTDELIQEISAQPNFLGVVGVFGDPSSATFTFNHTTEQEIEFKQFLATKLSGLQNDSLSQYTQFPEGTWVYGTHEPVTLTNIGSTYRNLYTASDGMSFGIDIVTMKELRLQVHWTKVGTGTQSLQIVDKNNQANVLATLPNLSSGNNLGSIVPIPAIFRNTKNLFLIQVKSTVAADDPVFHGLNLYMR
jgi:hypothetical protein